MTRPWSLLRLFGAVLVSGAVLSCGGSDTGTPPDDDDDPITQVVVAPSTDEIDLDGTTTLSATVTTRSGQNVTSSSSISWSSTDAGVATVAGNGATAVVTGVGEGTATLRATAGGRTGSAVITVTDPNPPAPPSSVTAVAVSDTETDLGWSDNADNEDEYRVEREDLGASAVEGSGPAAAHFELLATLDPDATSYRDSGLDPSGSYRYVVRACNQNGCVPEHGSSEEDDATSNDVTTHETLVFETMTLPTGTVGQSYQVDLASSGGDGTFEYGVSTGTLPAGLELSSGGSLSGTPTAAGESTFTVEVVSGEQTASREFTLEISEEPQPPEVTTTTLATGVVGEAYADQITANKGDGENYAFAVTAGSPPAGVSVNADGSVTGTPTAAGSSTFTVEVTSDGMTGSAELSIDVYEDLAVSSTTLPSGVEGKAYSETLVATGGLEPYAWAFSGGALPQGLSVSSDGTVSGTVAASAQAPPRDGPATSPAAAGTSTFEVTVTSHDGQSATADVTIDVFAALAITTNSLPDGQTGSAYSETVVATGGDGSYAFTLAGGNLPDGLSLNGSNGVISGTPTDPGIYNFSVMVESGDGQAVAAALTIEVTAGPPVVTTTSLADGQVGVFYSQTLEAAGGDGSFAWAVVAGSPPGGVSLNGSTGVISGTPATDGTFTFTVEVTSAAQTDEQELTIEVAPASMNPVSIDTEFLVGGNVGVAYTDAISASGGNGTFAYAVIAGALPDGLSLDPGTGALTGSPTASGVFYFTVEVTSGAESSTHTYAVAISTNAPAGFNMWVMNVSTGGTIPSTSVITAIESALAKWEDVITGDLPPANLGGIGGTTCSGDGQKLNGETIDDMVVMLNLSNIDGPGNTLGSAGPCWIFSSPLSTIFGRLTLDTSDLGALDTHQRYALAFHEIGHIVGIGTLWSSGSLISGAGTADPRYEGTAGNAEFVSALAGGSAGATKIPIEGDGGQGTADGHWDEGEFDAEMMTGWSEQSGKLQPLSSMTIAAVGDFGYTVDAGAADTYGSPGCAPNCTAAPPAGVSGGADLGIRLLDDILREPIGVVRPDGTVIYVTPRGGR